MGFRKAGSFSKVAADVEDCFRKSGNYAAMSIIYTPPIGSSFEAFESHSPLQFFAKGSALAQQSWTGKKRAQCQHSVIKDSEA